MQLTFLGTGDSLGTPRVYCDCQVCVEARLTGMNRRYRSSLWLEEKDLPPLLLDCGPDWRIQMEAIGRRKVTQALITHAHMDHIAGLTEWADSCRWQEEQASIFAPLEVLNEVRTRYPWVENQLKMYNIDNGMSYGKWRIWPWRVNHGKNGYSYAYRFDHQEDGQSWVYCSDAINLTVEQLVPMQNVSLLVLGTSYVKEAFEMETRSVYDMHEGLQLAAETHSKRVIFTHLSHDVNVDMDMDYKLPSHVTLAKTGMKVEI
ncbi:MAG: MBL fold metallo-hydrolase [Candidatus Cohnella colombiensis]|uniref:MBL fold metallo-hydrolase n=1 Tax=Candidatus Cohnella colombiensis TaxID=3121368 RepID=A0AA95JD18_9BACL|nr:MAG: MBL fold metallo-hydrolase [Cohnella sp.]